MLVGVYLAWSGVCLVVVLVVIDVVPVILHIGPSLGVRLIEIIPIVTVVPLVSVVPLGPWVLA